MMVKCKHSVGPPADAVGPALGSQSVMPRTEKVGGYLWYKVLQIHTVLLAWQYTTWK